MRRTDCHGKPIDYDAPGQLGRHSAKPQKLPRVDRFRQQLDRLVEYYNGRGQKDLPLRVTMDQIRKLEKIPPDMATWRPTGYETYRDHPLVVTEDP